MKPDLQFRLDQVAQSLKQQDYRSAAQQLKTLWQEYPDNPWVQIYRARLYEAAKKFDQAETIYRQLLRHALNPKVALQARQGLQRLQATEQAQLKAALAESKANIPNGAAPGILVLEAIPQAARQSAALHMAKVMQLDAYTARMQIPNRGWKLYRIGDFGEMQFYGQQIRAGNIPAFWVLTETVKTIPVFQVRSLHTIFPQATVVCENSAGQVGEIQFDWSEVSQRVDGALPVTERVVSIDVLRDRPDGRSGKEETFDYVRVCDLHLSQRNCILRLSDRTYNYQEGVLLAETGSLDQYSTRMQWNALMFLLHHQMQTIPVWHDFAPFAELAMDFPLLLQQMSPRLTVYNQTESLWPGAFHLYSGLAYYRNH